MIKTLQKKISTLAGEEEGSDIKVIENMIKEFKSSVGKRVDKLRAEMIEGFIKNDCEKLEAKIIERMNDVTIALTKELADRNDTKKNFRLIERQLKNIFNMALQGLRVTG